MEHTERSFTAFAGDRRIVTGELRGMLAATKAHLDSRASDLQGAPVLIFDDETGQQVDFDFRGTIDDVLERVMPVRAGPGRPKLGVICREVSLLPRQWEWLEAQPRGISAALRRLVDEARKREPTAERARRARDAAGKFMWAIAGNLPGFEEASRALYADDEARLVTLTRRWPKDIRDHVRRLIAAL